MKGINLLIISLLCSCSSNSSTEMLENKKRPEVSFYSDELRRYSIDTVMNIGNHTYRVVAHYSDIPGNTSDIKWENNDSIFSEKTRNYFAQVDIEKDGRVILNRRFTKEDFKEQLHTDSLYYYILTDFKFDRVKNNKLIFKSSVCMMNSDDLTDVFIEVNSTGQTQFTNGSLNQEQ